MEASREGADSIPYYNDHGRLNCKERAHVFFSFATENEWLTSNPRLYFYATAYQLINIVAIVASVLNLMVSTSPQFWDRSYDQVLGIFIVDTITVAFFSFDYLMRLVTSPVKRTFLVDILNLFDLFFILSYIIAQIMESVGRTDTAIQVLYVLKLLRITQVFQVFRLGRYSRLLNASIAALKKSTDALVIFVILMSISLVLNATLMFFAEQTWESFNVTALQWVYVKGPRIGEVSSFQSIWGTFWWAITTLTYVGYGDNPPQSPLGRSVYVFAIFTAIFSFLAPISVVLSRVNVEVTHFEDVKSAPQLRDYSHSKLLIKVFQLNQELNVNMSEMSRTQKTLGILLYKVGKMAILSKRNDTGNKFTQIQLLQSVGEDINEETEL